VLETFLLLLKVKKVMYSCW